MFAGRHAILATVRSRAASLADGCGLTHGGRAVGRADSEPVLADAPNYVAEPVALVPALPTRRLESSPQATCLR